MVARMRVRVIGAVLIGGLAAAGCAIPTQSVPNAIPPSKVPFDLLDPHLPTTTSTTPASVPAKIYLLNPSQKLVAVSRVVQFPGLLKSVIVDLLQGPTKKEEAAGIKTAIPGNVRVISASVSKTPQVATVNFNDAFNEIAGSETELAVAQVVFTVVTQTSITTGVLFQVNGEPIPFRSATAPRYRGPSTSRNTRRTRLRRRHERDTAAMTAVIRF